MKKLFLLPGFIMMILVGFSQIKGTHEFGLTIGGPTSNDFLDAANQIIESAFPTGNTTYTNKTTTPSISAYYNE